MTPRPMNSLRITGVALCVAMLVSCVNDRITSSRSSSLLIVERIGAAQGGTADDPINTYLQSDVLTEGGIFEDIGRVTLRIALKDPGSTESPLEPSSANYVTINRYRVEYRRTDGRNTPGVDVPFAIDGGMTVTVVSGIQTAEFVLVRASAKLEPPLRALANGGGAIVINTIAYLTFYGYDQTGADVMGEGTIGIDFADWADENQTGGAP